MGIPGQAINLRLRDGTINSSTATDAEGEYGMDEVFPFFKYLVAEVDFLRFKATGMTAVVDLGGPLAPGRSTTLSRNLTSLAHRLSIPTLAITCRAQRPDRCSLKHRCYTQISSISLTGAKSICFR